MACQLLSSVANQGAQLLGKHAGTGP